MFDYYSDTGVTVTSSMH